MDSKETHSRQIVLDTETTGMNRDGVHYLGHKIIEIGCVEVINRRLTGRHYHVYINPEMRVDPEAIEVHGITDEMLEGKPTFADIATEFMEFIKGADLVIHNAPFDIGFMDYEFSMLPKPLPKTETYCTVTDTLVMARKLFPGKRNNLNILSDRYGVDTSKRTLHGALLDAEILADVYLLMTGGQTSLNLKQQGEDNKGNGSRIQAIATGLILPVLLADALENQAHETRLELVKKKGGSCIWLES